MKRGVWSLAILLLLCLITDPSLPQAVEFKVVVHVSNPAASLTRGDIASLFLKKKKSWDHGLGAVPVDQAPNSAVRREFSKAIHGRSVAAIKSHWQRQIFSGRSVPPPEKTSDAEVLDFVASNRGAIGYVGSGMSLGSEVRELTVDR